MQIVGFLMTQLISAVHVLFMFQVCANKVKGLIEHFGDNLEKPKLTVR